jgi:hypothetical protein
MDKLKQILELKGTLLDAKEEILALREQLQELEQAKKYAQEMTFDERVGVYRETDEGGNPLATAKSAEWSITAAPRLELSTLAIPARRAAHSIVIRARKSYQSMGNLTQIGNLPPSETTKTCPYLLPRPPFSAKPRGIQPQLKMDKRTP